MRELQLIRAGQLEWRERPAPTMLDPRDALVRPFIAGRCPIALRLRNEPDLDLSRNVPFSTRRLSDCFGQGAAAFGWPRRNPTPAATRDGNQLIGIGTAAAVYKTERMECTVSARVTANGTTPSA